MMMLRSGKRKVMKLQQPSKRVKWETHTNEPCHIILHESECMWRILRFLDKKTFINMKHVAPGLFFPTTYYDWLCYTDEGPRFTIDGSETDCTTTVQGDIFCELTKQQMLDVLRPLLAGKEYVLHTHTINTIHVQH